MIIYGFNASDDWAIASFDPFRMGKKCDANAEGGDGVMREITNMKEFTLSLDIHWFQHSIPFPLILTRTMIYSAFEHKTLQRSRKIFIDSTFNSVPINFDTNDDLLGFWTRNAPKI